MIRTAVGLMSVAVVSLVASTARADGWGFYYGPSYRYRYGHELYHNDLDYREYQREVDHEIAHQFPMTRGEHNRLHHALDYERAVDAAEHRKMHRINSGGCYGVGSYGGGVIFGNRRTQFYIGW